jgi:polyhydroxyalkanoate synthesis regulator phasin
MNTKQKAVEDIKKFGRMYKGFLAVAEDLERLGSLEQAMKEAEGRMALMLDEEKKKAAELEEMGRNLESVKAEGAQILRAANSDASAIVKEAMAKGEELVVSADAIAAQTKAKAEELYAEAEKEVKAMSDKVMVLDSEITAKEAQLKELEEQIAAIKERFK